MGDTGTWDAPRYAPMHDNELIEIIAVGLGLAFILGAAAHRLRLSPLVGYLLAGVLVGPFTPGFVGDQDLALQLSEIGVVLLMFGVGLHFSFEDLFEVRAIAVPGAVSQIAVATLLGAAMAWGLDWSWQEALVFGLALSVASTVVLLRALDDRRLLETKRGRIAVGWLIVEDLVMVLALVLLPALADSPGSASDGIGSALVDVGWAVVSVGAFVALMLVVGRRVIPWTLEKVAAHRIRRAVHAVGARHRPRGGVRLGPAVQRVLRPRRLLRRDDPQRVGAERQGRQ